MSMNETSCCSAARMPAGAYFALPTVASFIDGFGLSEIERNSLVEAVASEWEMFDSVVGLEGRASCQDDARRFFVYRCAQRLAFPACLLPKDAAELRHALEDGRNLVEEKYARMMEKSDPEHWRASWQHRLAPVSPVKAEALSNIRQILTPCLSEAAQDLPETHRHARPDDTQAGRIGSFDYLEAELACYGLKTLFAYEKALAAYVHTHNPILDSYLYAQKLWQLTEER